MKSELGGPQNKEKSWHQQVEDTKQGSQRWFDLKARCTVASKALILSNCLLWYYEFFNKCKQTANVYEPFMEYISSNWDFLRNSSGLD